MSVYIAPTFGIGYQGFTSGGLPLNGGLIYTYIAGGTTPQATYTTVLGNVQNANPVQLDSAGRTPSEIWLTVGVAYRFDLKDSDGNLIKTYDDIGTTAFTMAEDLANTSSVSKGDALVGVKRTVSGAVATTLHAYIERQIFNVKADFGAVMDGVTDDYAALRNAQTALTNGGIIYIPEGTLAIGTAFTLAAGVTLQGAGKNTTTIKWIGGNTTAVITVSNPQANNVFTSSHIRDMTINANTATTMTGISFVDAKRNTVRNVMVKSSVTATGTGIRLQGGSGGNGETYNCVWNRFYDIDISGFQVGIQCDGTATTPTVSTLNQFFGLNIYGPGATGIRFTQWCDSNEFHGVEIFLTANTTTGIIHNDSATPAVDTGVYSNNFYNLAVDSFGLAGCVGILFNFTKQNQVYGFFHSPETFNGTLISDNAGRSISHYIVNSQRSASQNSIEIVQKGLWIAEVQAGSGTVTYGAGPTDVAFATERYDVTSSFATPTFTAPVTGKYRFALSLTHTTGVTPNDVWRIKVVTTALTYDYFYAVAAALENTVSLTQSCDMTAADTLKVTIERFSGGGNFVLINSAASNVLTIDFVGP